MHGKIRGILLLVCPTTSTVRHRNADNQDNLSKTIVLKICHHLRSGEFDAAIRFLLHASRLETKSGMAVKLPFAVLEFARHAGRSSALLERRLSNSLYRIFYFKTGT